MRIHGKTYLRAKEIAPLLGISVARMWILDKAPNFPKSYKPTTRCTLWCLEDVVEFIENQKKPEKNVLLSK